MSERPPVEPPVTRYWRPDCIEQGCVSERHDLAASQAAELDSFEDLLMEGGLDFEQAEIATAIFAKFCREAGDRRAAFVIREMLLAIEKTKVGKTPEFKAVLFVLSPGERLEDFADQHGISRQLLAYHVDKIRPFFCAATA